MDLGEMRKQILYQTNNDADDLGDFLPHLNDYVNEGYDRAVQAWCGEHVSEDSEVYTPLVNEHSTPALPAWTHRAMVDWATWLVYRNGNPGKQNRGAVFRASAEEKLATISGLMDDQKTYEGVAVRRPKQYIHNIPL